MKSQTIQDQKQILATLPELIKKATLAQTQLSEMVSNFEVTQDGVLRSTLAPVNGAQRFTRQFEGCSGELCFAVTEANNNLSAVMELIEQIHEATKDLVVGVETQLKVNPVASMRDAVNSLDSTMRTRPTSSMPAVKH